MIDIKNLDFKYRKGTSLFSDLSLQFEQGYIYGLLGKNGMGKTTLLKLICGLLFPKNGTVNIHGDPTCLRHAETLQKIYFLPEEFHMPHLTLKQYYQYYTPFYPNFSIEQFEENLQIFDLHLKQQYLDKLSHGQKRKVMISFALATNTPLLIMDEPTNGLDIPSKTEFRKIMATSASEDRLIIISTHQVRDLHSLIDAVTILHNGQILLNQPIANISEKLAFQAIASDTDKVIYVEDGIYGHMGIRLNDQQVETQVDLELLFNASITHPSLIAEIFENESKNIQL